MHTLRIESIHTLLMGWIDSIKKYGSIKVRIDHCQKSRILFMYLSKYVCHFHSLEAAFYLAIALIKEKI